MTDQPPAVERAPRARRAAGTRTFLDVLRDPLGRRRDPVRDEADLRAEQALRVAAYRRAGRWRRGSLLLDLRAADPVTWRPWPAGPPVAVEAEAVDVRPVGAGDRLLDDRFVVLRVRAGGAEQELAVPAVDLPSVRAALVAGR